MKTKCLYFKIRTKIVNFLKQRDQIPLGETKIIFKF